VRAACLILLKAALFANIIIIIILLLLLLLMLMRDIDVAILSVRPSVTLRYCIETT